jgi:predicted porin
MRTTIPHRQALTATLIAAAMAALLVPGRASASEADLLKRLEAVEAQLKAAQAKPEASTPAKPARPPVVSQTDGITIYGRVDLTTESSDDGTVSRTVMQNISSRIGFSGNRKLTDDLSGIMQIETGVAPDDNANSGTFASRNSYVGLRSQSMGTLIAGRHDMPFKKLEGVSAPLWGSAEAMEIIIHGKGTARQDSAAKPFSNFHTRQANVLQYWSPKFSDVEIRLAYSPDEVNGAVGTTKKPIYGGSVEYDNGTWNVGLAQETKESATVTSAPIITANQTGLKATAGMKFSGGTFGVAYSQLDNGVSKKTNNWMIAGTYKTGPVVLKANYGVTSETASGAQDGLSMVGLGVDYPLDRYTTFYGYATTITNDTNARGRFEAGDNKYSPVAGLDPRAIGVGLRYNF